MNVGRDQIHLYLGCETNKGKLIGILKDRLFIESPGKAQPDEYEQTALGKTIFLHLRMIGDLNEDQSEELIAKGFSIGRPSGYSFSNDAILFLLSLSVDLFGLINSGIARHIKTSQGGRQSH